MAQDMSNENKAERKVSPLRKTIDNIIQVTGGVAAADILFKIVPGIITGDYGDYPTIHEYLGVSSDYNELSGAIASFGATYMLVFRKSLVGKHFWQ